MRNVGNVAVHAFVEHLPAGHPHITDDRRVGAEREHCVQVVRAEPREGDILEIDGDQVRGSAKKYTQYKRDAEQAP